jgi:predicted amidohydrolase
MMANEVTIAAVQCTPYWNNKAANYQMLSDALAAVEADVIVLPELCTTDYSFLNKEEAFNATDEAVTVAAFFASFTKEKKAVLVAGFAERDGQDVYNSAIIVLPDGSYEIYRKTHLFFKEKLCFANGNTGFKTIQHPLKDCRIGVMVCYDWRFPESARSLALQGADIICVPANLVTTVWETGMKARALENNVFVAVANRCGTEERMLDNGGTQTLRFNGKSVLYNIDGTPIAQLSETENNILTVTVDVDKSRNKFFNEFNNIFTDRRPDLYSR